ncbi:MAG: DUF3368 domain-containing protein [Desulfotignum sp.]|nr:DUF3368 domain-containing protein [Desulfotignum sp.]
MFDRAVVNAGPLVALALLDLLDLLPALFAECWVPEARQRGGSGGFEIGKPGAESLKEATGKVVSKLTPLPRPRCCVVELDFGEAEVISMARNLSPCMAIIDERRGRRIARHVYGLSVKGTAGILVEAKRRSLINAVHPLLLELRASGYYLADNVITAACQAVDE